MGRLGKLHLYAGVWLQNWQLQPKLLPVDSVLIWKLPQPSSNGLRSAWGSRARGFLLVLAQLTQACYSLTLTPGVLSPKQALGLTHLHTGSTAVERLGCCLGSKSGPHSAHLARPNV